MNFAGNSLIGASTMQKLQRRGQPNMADTATIPGSSVQQNGDESGTPVKYRLTVQCRATIEETWAFESKRLLSHDELEDQLVAGNMRFVGEETIGDEESRQIVRVDMEVGMKPTSSCS